MEMEDLNFVSYVNGLNRWRWRYLSGVERIKCLLWRNVQSLLMENELDITEEEVRKITHDIILHIESSPPPLLEYIMSESWLQMVRKYDISEWKQEQAFSRELFHQMSIIGKSLSPPQLTIKIVLLAHPILYYDSVASLFKE